MTDPKARVVEIIRDGGQVPISTFVAEGIYNRLGAEGLIAPDLDTFAAILKESSKTPGSYHWDNHDRARDLLRRFATPFVPKEPS